MECYIIHCNKIEWKQWAICCLIFISNKDAESVIRWRGAAGVGESGMRAWGRVWREGGWGRGGGRRGGGWRRGRFYLHSFVIPLVCVQLVVLHHGKCEHDVSAEPWINIIWGIFSNPRAILGPVGVVTYPLILGTYCMQWKGNICQLYSGIKQ